MSESHDSKDMEAEGMFSHLLLKECFQTLKFSSGMALATFIFATEPQK
jgi:hypothetical protein